MKTPSTPIPIPDQVVISPTDIQLIRSEAVAPGERPVIMEATSLQVKTADDYLAADSLLLRLTKARAQLRESLLKPVETARSALNSIDKLFQSIDAPWKKAEADLRQRMSQYKTEEARRIAEEERKRAEAARAALRAAAEERIRADQIAAEARRASQQAADKEKARAILEQSRAEAQAAIARAQENDRQARAHTAPTQSTTPVQAPNTRTRTVYKWRVVDLETFVLAIINGDAPGAGFHMLDINQQNMVAHFTIARAEMATWPGIEVYPTEEIVRK